MFFLTAWNDDWISVGWHEGWEQTYDTSACSSSLGGLDLGARSSPKRFEWEKMNLDTGAAVNTFPLNFGPDGQEMEDSIEQPVANGFLMVVLGNSPRIRRERVLRSLNGRLTGVNEVLCSAAEIARVGSKISTWDMTVGT